MLRTCWPSSTSGRWEQPERCRARPGPRALFLDGAADGPQVAAEGQGRILPPPGQVGLELDLAAQRFPGPDLPGLVPLRVVDGVRQREQLAGRGGGNEEHAVVIAEHEVVAADRPVPDGRGRQ